MSVKFSARYCPQIVDRIARIRAAGHFTDDENAQWDVLVAHVNSNCAEMERIEDEREARGIPTFGVIAYSNAIKSLKETVENLRPYRFYNGESTKYCPGLVDKIARIRTSGVHDFKEHADVQWEATINEIKGLCNTLRRVETTRNIVGDIAAAAREYDDAVDILEDQAAALDKYGVAGGSHNRNRSRRRNRTRQTNKIHKLRSNSKKAIRHRKLGKRKNETTRRRR